MLPQLDFNLRKNGAVANPLRFAHDDLRAGHVSLKEWRILHAVATCGSISNAAEFLHLTRPAISYTISQLEEKLGFSLMEVQGRKSYLTEKGEVLLDRSWSLLKEAKELEEFAGNISKGHEPMIQLAVTHGFPNHTLVSILKSFSEQSDKQVRLKVVSENELSDITRNRKADLVLTRSFNLSNGEMPVLEEDYVPVAHPEHPLFLTKGERTLVDLERTIRIVANDMDIAAEFISTEFWQWLDWRWDVHSFEEAEIFLQEQMGYGWLPLHRVKHHLESGVLKPVLDIQDYTFTTKFFLMSPRSIRADSSIKMLKEAIVSTCDTNR